MLFKPDRIATYLTVCILVVIWNAVNDLHALLKDYKMCDNAKKVNAKKLKNSDCAIVPECVNETKFIIDGIDQFYDELTNNFFTEMKHKFIYVIIFGTALYILLSIYPNLPDYGKLTFGSRYSHSFHITIILIVIYIITHISLFLPKNEIDDIRLDSKLVNPDNDIELAKLFEEHKIDLNAPHKETTSNIRYLIRTLHPDKENYAHMYDKETRSRLYNKLNIFIKQYKALHRPTNRQADAKFDYKANTKPDDTEDDKDILIAKAKERLTAEEIKREKQREEEKPLLYFIGNTWLYRWFAKLWITSISPDITAIISMLIPLTLCIILLPTTTTTINFRQLNTTTNDVYVSVLTLISFIYIFSSAIIQIIYERLKYFIYTSV